MREKLDIDKYISRVLLAGVVLSMATLVLGSVLYVTGPINEGRPGSIVEILRGVVKLDPTSTINLGLLILLMTPVARIIAALIAFAIERDLKYVLISIFVLIVLLLSAVMGSAKCLDGLFPTLEPRLSSFPSDRSPTPAAPLSASSRASSKCNPRPPGLSASHRCFAPRSPLHLE